MEREEVLYLRPASTLQEAQEIDAREKVSPLTPETFIKRINGLSHAVQTLNAMHQAFVTQQEKPDEFSSDSSKDR